MQQFHVAPLNLMNYDHTSLEEKEVLSGSEFRKDCCVLNL